MNKNENQIEYNLDQQPLWFYLPEKEKQKHTYWACGGTILRSKVYLETKFIKLYSNIYHSKEEAEAHAYVSSGKTLKGKTWVWNKKPASPVTLQEAMFRARRNGLAGVAVAGFVNGKWIALKQYEADVPLSD